MNTNVIVVIAVVVLIVVVIAAVLVTRRRKSEQLKDRFGPEYERTVKSQGDIRKAEGVLAERAKRVDSFKIHDLPDADRDRFAADWSGVQRKFVDDPRGAVADADGLVTRLMSARGYPMGDFEQRAADISASYPNVVQNYRAARTIAVRQSQGDSTTEDLRQAMVYYRSLFDELLGTKVEKGV